MKDVRWDDGATIKSGGEPEMVGIVGNTSQQDKAATANHLVCPPYSLNDHGGESVCPKK